MMMIDNLIYAPAIDSVPTSVGNMLFSNFNLKVVCPTSIHQFLTVNTIIILLM